MFQSTEFAIRIFWNGSRWGVRVGSGGRGSFRGRLGGRIFDEDGFSGRLGPCAFLAEAGGSADGVEDVPSCDAFGAACLLDDVFQLGAVMSAAAREQFHGVGVAVNGSVIGDPVFACNFFGALPLKEGLLDGFAIRVAADDATSAVPFEGTAAAAAFGGTAAVAGLSSEMGIEGVLKTCVFLGAGVGLRFFLFGHDGR